ncbi:MAG: ATP-dependent RNA helicase HrpA [Rothia sp. (in: high G+C Gram-positive bacteria)]|uniref:ATP-dependent RNA helicase HrpA n=1 Tax=Rothia sp. (in: high G+C Gram-positive bacteria) TaxID=1885016 RepID=UPI0026DFBC52|nr:ATP-dependent RNA helicase HrpA [Rothia sp. (in: high G+C Gram-positive bacteria)]MDO5750757.1 ATP-dependent RNA helicase HrpA [Rothia sp. (in: high G+C Gram-positive bacteria)]
MSTKNTQTQASPSLSSMAAAIHAAGVRAAVTENSRADSQKQSTKNSQKNSSRSRRSSRVQNASAKGVAQGASGQNQRANDKQSKRSSSKGAKNRGSQKPAEQAPYSPYIPETILYPEELPVSERRADIMRAIAENQVVIVAGETGSGKTTQLPKMCLELGLGAKGLIGHTQPRRLAARSVAERIAEELGQQIGETVGYQVRFTSDVSEKSAIKLMTDGILLAEIQHDKLLSKYSVLIIDEAHERSLNIDFILGYLKRILPQRPDLKVIITSATIDPERFARHFSPSYVPGKGIVDESLSEEERALAEEILPDDAPPIIEVSGRTYPVEIRYRPLEGEWDDESEEQDLDPIDGILEAVRELSKEAPGDILIFFSGEREIRDAQDALESMIAKNPRMVYDVLPLYARLSLAEQHRVFKPGPRPRIVLATNVAETSLTVPGIKYVIDTGTARISRYSARTKVQRLPIERISQASANQRSGRCGRVSDGIAIRLYSEEDFDSRAEFTDPEILRTNLAAVILQMVAIGVVRAPGDIARFPFVQPPNSRAINDGVQLLRELGALAETTRRVRGSVSKQTVLTSTGRAMSALPVDPRLSRMIIEGSRRGVAKEMMVLAAALTIQDPRERPSEVRGEADAAHARFNDTESDFSSLMLLWQYVNERQSELSSSQFRKMCHREFLNFVRLREWQDLFAQLREMGRSANISVSAGREIDPSAHEEQVHKSLLSGLLSQIGAKEEREPSYGKAPRGPREYLGARGTRFAIFPGSALFRKNPDWVLSAELVETSRLWARMNASIKPEWVEEVAKHLIKRQYAEPHWSVSQGAALALAKGTLYGLTIFADRTVQYARVDMAAAREIFIRSALVEGQWTTRHKFYTRNQRALAQVEELEARLRRRDLRVDDQVLFEFYDARIPEHVYDVRSFDSWWKQERLNNDDLLDFNPDKLINEDAGSLDDSDFPRQWVQRTPGGELSLDLRYEYAPAAHLNTSRTEEAMRDGVAVQVPLLFLNQLDPEPFRWQIPGLRHELLTALIKSLPKAIRRNFVPAPDVARSALEVLTSEFSPAEDKLLDSFALVLRRLRGVVVEPEAFDWEALPAHLKFTFQVRNARNTILGESKSIVQLQQDLHKEIRSALADSLGASSGDIAALQAIASGASDATPGVKSGGAQGAKPGAQPGTAQGSAGVQGASASGLSERAGITVWDKALGENGVIPRKIQRVIATQAVTGYPALTDEGSSVALRIFPTEQQQLHAQRSGVIRLLQLMIPSPVRYVSEHLSNKEKIVFTQNPHGSIDALLEDCTVAALDKLVPRTPVFGLDEFRELYEHVRAELIDTVFEITKLVAEIFAQANATRKAVKKATSLSTMHAVSDVKAQVDDLVYPGFIAQTGYAQLIHLPRYLRAAQLRLEKLGPNLHRDNQLMLEVQDIEDAYDKAVSSLPPGTLVSDELRAVDWMIQELRVSFFAQELGTAYTVSSKRIAKAQREALDQLKQ